jgi:type I restriction enzyme M protein
MGAASMGDAKNKFGSLRDIHNESDVEQFFVIRLLRDLGYKDDQIRTKESLDELKIGRGRKKELYKPDYVLFVDGKPRIVIDAKNPSDNIEDFLYQVSGYALAINQSYREDNPVQYCVLSNAALTNLYPWDSDSTIQSLTFEEFEDTNKKYTELKKTLDPKVMRQEEIDKETRVTLIKPPLEVIEAVFQKCHNLIHKRESPFPTQAFYEFTKLIFLKMNEDKRLHVIIDSGREIRLNDLHFHTHWINENLSITPNPVNDILFQKLVADIEELVERKKKKPIFDKNEQIKLKPSTIYDVINMLQEFDLYGIDADLNGRMFEVFLAAIVRGKKLGAYFTPRSIVKLMVNMADIKIISRGSDTDIETTLDGCCGSGGFLIDVMAHLINEINTNPTLSHKSKELIERVVRDHLYGIDVNPDIARIARINMYLHGDGGSSIYRANTLDKKVTIEEGEDKTSRKELEELKKLLIEDKKKFDIIVTNPPFATSFAIKDEHEKNIIEQYASTNPVENMTYKTGTTELKSEIKSNVLFLGRYHDLLRPGGRMLIVVDNSLLNSSNFAEYRIWLKNNFIIRAIISLPKYSFIQAGAGGVTSILYLEKRTSGEQKQPKIFARRVRYTGISKSGKEIPENDLPDVLREWKRFEATGKLYLKSETEVSDYSSDELFLIGETPDRLDVDFYIPSYRSLMDKLSRYEKDGTHELKKIDDFDLSPHMTREEGEDNVFLYADIGALDLERGEIILSECIENDYEELPNRARIHVNKNDVIFPLSYDSLGKAAIIPEQMDGQLVSTGFMSIRCKDLEEAYYLWALIRSDVMQKQFLHVASGYTQRGISKEHLSAYINFPITRSEKGEVVKVIQSYIAQANEARKRELEAYANVTKLMNDQYE